MSSSWVLGREVYMSTRPYACKVANAGVPEITGGKSSGITIWACSWGILLSSAQIFDRQLAKELDRSQVCVDLDILIGLMRKLWNARAKDQEWGTAGGLKDAGVSGIPWRGLRGLASALSLENGQRRLDNRRLRIAGDRPPFGDHAHFIGELGDGLTQAIQRLPNILQDVLMLHTGQSAQIDGRRAAVGHDIRFIPANDRPDIHGRLIE